MNIIDVIRVLLLKALRQLLSFTDFNMGWRIFNATVKEIQLNLYRSSVESEIFSRYYLYRIKGTQRRLSIDNNWTRDEN